MGAIAAAMLVPMIRADLERPRELTPEQWLRWVRSGLPRPSNAAPWPQ
jgi:hypothetical protein